MTYYELLQLLEKTALEEPVIKTVIASDIYKLNTHPTIDYGVFCPVVDTISQDESFRYYRMFLYYVDRLAPNNNAEEIQSAALDVLTNVLQKLEDLVMDDKEFTLFTAKFVDMTAGAFCRVTLQVPLEPCPVE